MPGESQLQRKKTEVRIADVPLSHKLDVLGASIAAVREAHRDVMSARCWAALNVAQEKIAEAQMNSLPVRQLQTSSDAPSLDRL